MNPEEDPFFQLHNASQEPGKSKPGPHGDPDPNPKESSPVPMSSNYVPSESAKPMPSSPYNSDDPSKFSDVFTADFLGLEEEDEAKGLTSENFEREGKETPYIPGSDPSLISQTGHDLVPSDEEEPDPFHVLLEKLKKGREFVSNFQDNVNKLQNLTRFGSETGPTTNTFSQSSTYSYPNPGYPVNQPKPGYPYGGNSNWNPQGNNGSYTPYGNQNNNWGNANPQFTPLPPVQGPTNLVPPALSPIQELDDQLYEELQFDPEKTRPLPTPDETEIVEAKLKVLRTQIEKSHRKYKNHESKSGNWAFVFRFLSSLLAAVVTVLLGINVTDTLRDWGIDWYINTLALAISAFLSIIGMLQSYFDADELYAKYTETASQLDHLLNTLDFVEKGKKYLTLKHVNLIRITYSKILDETIKYELFVKSVENDAIRNYKESKLAPVNAGPTPVGTVSPVNNANPNQP